MEKTEKTTLEEFLGAMNLSKAAAEDAGFQVNWWAEDDTYSSIYPDPMSLGMAENLVGYLDPYGYSFEEAFYIWANMPTYEEFLETSQETINSFFEKAKEPTK